MSVIIIINNRAHNFSSPGILQRCKEKNGLKWEVFEIHIQMQTWLKKNMLKIEISVWVSEHLEISNDQNL